MSRRKFLAATLAATLVATSPAAAWPVHGIPPQTSGGMLMNVGGVSYYTGEVPFLNWWLTASTTTVVSTLNGTVNSQAAWNAVGTASPGGGTAYFNPSTGELNNPCPSDVTSISRIFFTPTPFYQYISLSGNPWWYGATFTVEWSGTATATLTGNPGSGGSSSFGANSGTITLGTTGVNNLGVQFAVTNKSDPPHNIKIFQSKYAANVAAGQYFNPDWVADVQPFGVLRFMDWNDIIDGGGISDISQFADANYNSIAQYGRGQAYFTGAISGTTLTVSGLVAADVGNVGPNVALSDTTGALAAGTVVVQQLTGSTGSNGTYQVNISQTVASEAMTSLAIVGSYNGPYGPKSGVHPSIICQLANLTGCNVHYNIPNAMTNAGMQAIAQFFQSNLNSNLWVKFEYGNENWNFAQGNFYYCEAQIYPGTGTSGQAYAFAGYRTAQLWAIVNAVYGPTQRSRWRGALGTQATNIAVSTTGFAGALYAINNPGVSGVPAGLNLSNLFDEMDMAVYFANGESSTGIGANNGSFSSVSVGTTTTCQCGTGGNPFSLATFTGTASGNQLAITSVTGTIAPGALLTGSGVPAGTFIVGQISGTAGGAGVYQTSQATTATAAGLTAAQIVRLFFSNTGAGTIGSLLNNQDVVLSAATTSSFSFTNYGGNSGSGAINTTGLTYSNTGQYSGYAANGLLFDLMDNGAANHTSSPSQYPTIYTYFAEQISESIMIGAADNGYATTASGSGLSPTFANSVPSFIQQQALISDTFGVIYGTGPIRLGFYEGGSSLGGALDSNLWGSLGSGLGGNSQFLSYMMNWAWDTGQSGSYTVEACYAALYEACGGGVGGQIGGNAPYPAQFVELGSLAWIGLRYFPGDESTAKWQGIIEQNVLGPYVDPTLAATGTYSFIASNFYNGTPAAQTFTAAFGNNAAGLAVFACGAQNSPGISTVVLSGGTGPGWAGNITISVPDVSNSTNEFIFSAVIPANSGTVTVTINWGSGAGISRGAYVYLFTGLASNAVQKIGVSTVPYVKGSALVYCATYNATPTILAGANDLIVPTIAPALVTKCASAIFDIPFSSQIMNVTPSGILATYR